MLSSRASFRGFVFANEGFTTPSSQPLARCSAQTVAFPLPCRAEPFLPRQLVQLTLIPGGRAEGWKNKMGVQISERGKIQ